MKLKCHIQKIQQIHKFLRTKLFDEINSIVCECFVSEIKNHKCQNTVIIAEIEIVSSH